MTNPTIVLVHGAFAESSSWNRVIEPLIAAGHRVIAVANPLRSLASDAAAVSDVVRQIEGPVVLVAHSYGGAVITNVQAENVVALVYVAAFAPAPGETAFGLSTMFPGSSLGDALEAWPRTDGTTDLTIARDRFHEQFCADVPAPEAALMAATQRPATQEALTEPSGETCLWKGVPSYFVVAELDRNIPAQLQRYLAERAGAEQTIELAGASHAAAVSRPDIIAETILEACALKAVA
ncbi:alpha/beta fold hydrolase [Solirubrobacter soli]|uniref:alpha/beta fold hydrolase n=1 Tax=Solirubrobacter soli TaxID=363832 RepID=UPI0004866959|nr:alpha/beta hydrolase [Solirubrobacter soli]